MAQAEVHPQELRPAVYSAAEVADLLALSKATVYALAHNGQLPCKRVGRRFIFSREAVHAWLETPDPAEPWHG